MKQLVSIYSHKWEEVKKGLDKLSRKAQKYGTPFSYSVTREFQKRVQILEPTNTQSGWVLFPIHEYWVDALEVEISCSPIKLNGWNLIAHIERMDEGDERVVTLLAEGEKVRQEWFTWPMKCDHCQTHRMRRAVYICRHDDGREVSVGSTCLKEYTGIDPLGIIDWAMVKDIIAQDEEDDDLVLGRGFTPLFGVREVIAYAVEAVAEYGYVKSGEMHSTKERIWYALHSEDKPKDESLAKAESIIEWVKRQNSSSEYMQNCRAICKQEAVADKFFGYLAFLPVAYDKAVAPKKTSSFVGTVGERLTVHPVDAKCLTSWGTMYGVTYMYSFKDADGNVFIWKTSKALDESKTYQTLTGTVKAHNEWKGLCQTELTRCKLA